MRFAFTPRSPRPSRDFDRTSITAPARRGTHPHHDVVDEPEDPGDLPRLQTACRWIDRDDLPAQGLGRLARQDQGPVRSARDANRLQIRVGRALLGSEALRRVAHVPVRRREERWVLQVGGDVVDGREVGARSEGQRPGWRRRPGRSRFQSRRSRGRRGRRRPWCGRARPIPPPAPPSPPAGRARTSTGSRTSARPPRRGSEPVPAGCRRSPVPREHPPALRSEICASPVRSPFETAHSLTRARCPLC